MPDTVIITIIWNKKEADFELPAKQPVYSWIESLQEALKSVFYDIRTQGKALRLLWKGTAIPGEATLEECGIYDGEVLETQLI